MTFVHGHPRDAGWVMSHYRRPREAGVEQLDLEIPTQRRPEDTAEDSAESTAEEDDVTDAGRRP